MRIIELKGGCNAYNQVASFVVCIYIRSSEARHVVIDYFTVSSNGKSRHKILTKHQNISDNDYS